MPELPEVETVKNELSPLVVGRKVMDVTLLWEGIVRQPSATEFRSRLTGQKITGINRRGKYLLFSLSNSETLIAHLKMSGALIAGRGKSEAVRFARAVLYFDDGSNLFFRDPRKFGRMWLVSDASSVVGKLGPEPLEADFTTQVLARRMLGRKAPIKALLCDQNIIAGVGNLYADEALFLARIHPLTEGGNFSQDRLKHLHAAIRQVLQKGIKNKGASIENYVRPDGNPGTAHLEFLMPRIAGEPCTRCGTPVERITVRGRGTYFCPKCQV